MKAFLLAGGLGTRLKPLTDSIPKSLVEVQGKSMIYWWTKLFEKQGIDEVLINTHTFPNQVAPVLINNASKIYWEMSFEPKLLGSAGTLRANRRFVRAEKEFLIAYVDVLTNCDLRKVIKFHHKKESPFTMVVTPVDDPTGKGIAEVKDDMIVSFEEKPDAPKSNLANMGIYVCSQEILDLIPKGDYADFADVLPKLVGKMFAYNDTNSYFCDIGTHEGLKYANETWKK